MLIKPRQQDEPLRADIEAARSDTDSLHIWWLGQSGFLLHWSGHHLLFDPYLSDSLTRKYAATDKPHVRLSERVMDPRLLPFVDVVTSSHNHTDHLDAETLGPVLENPDTRFVIPEANRAFVADRLGIDPRRPIGLTDDGTARRVGAFVFQGVPAAHNEIERDEQGRCKFMGYVVHIGPYTVYHSGDTLWYEGMVDLLKPFDVDVAFLPINGNRPERRVAGNLSADEAARLGREIGAKRVIPHHYDLFAFNTADPRDFVRACAQYGTPHTVPQLGERVTCGPEKGD